MSITFARYQPRIVRSDTPVAHNGYRLKTYTIRRKSDPFDRAPFEEGIQLALQALPEPARTNVRPALGFIILHQGRGKNYVVVSWWDHENELPTRVFVNEGTGWKKGDNNESFCVWDLEIMWYERQAYIATMLSGVTGDEDGYLRFSYKAGGDE